MKRIVFLVAMMAAISLGAIAQKPSRVPAYQGVIERVQPNGDTIQTLLRGDEHQHWLMTVDHWQLRENAKGWLVYAKIRKGEVVPSRKKAHNEAQRSKCENHWLNKHGIKLEMR